MTFLSDSDIERLGVDLAVANSASFVFRRFANDSVVRVGALRSAEELLSMVRSANSEHEPSFRATVAAYAASVAMLIGPNAAAMEAYAKGNSGSLRWLRGLVEIGKELSVRKVNVQQVGANAYAFNVSPTIAVMTSSPGHPTRNESSRVLAPAPSAGSSSITVIKLP